MSKRRIAGWLAVALGLVFFLSGLRYEPAFYIPNSAPICGPLTDGKGNVVGDAGPCPSWSPVPDHDRDRLVWQPFWEARR
jgi:hypothetical protein